MGTFVTQEATPTVFTDKETAPGATLPQGLTYQNVWRASDANTVKDALLDVREALRTTVNVKNYGALGDGATDDTDAIEAAIAAAEDITASSIFLNATVYFPPGIYRASRPFFGSSRVQFKGAGRQEVLLYPVAAFKGRQFIFAPDKTDLISPALVTSLVSGSGYALRGAYSGGAGDFYYDLSQLYLGRIPTNTAWTLSFYVQMHGSISISGNSTILGVAGSLWANQTNSLLSWQWNGDLHQWHIGFRYDGQLFSRYVSLTSAPTFAADTTYHVEISWSGSAMRVFINGELWTDGAWTPSGGLGSADGSGFRQYPWEHFAIGCGTPITAATSTLEGSYLDHTRDAFNFPDGVAHTASFTPSNAKAVGNGNTRVLINFDSFYKGCLVASGWNGTLTQYIYPWTRTYTQMPYTGFRNLSMFGAGGVHAEFADHMRIEEVRDLSPQEGWRFTNNGFFSRYRNIEIDASYGRYGFCDEGGAYCNLDGVVVGAPLGYLFYGSNFFGNTVTCQPHNNAYAGMVLRGATCNFNGFTLDSEENSSVGWLAPLIILGGQQIKFTAPTLYGPPNKQATTPCIMVDAGTENPQIEIDKPYLVVPTGSVPAIQTFSSGSGPTKFESPILLRQPFYYNGVPDVLCNEPLNVEVYAPVLAKQVNITAAGNVGGGEDDLMSTTLPASALVETKKGVRIRAWGTTANNANAKTLKLYFGSAAILTTSLTTGVAGAWRVDAEVYRTGSNAQSSVAELRETGTSASDIEVATPTQAETSDITIKTTGQGTADDDVRCLGLVVESI